MCSKPPSSAPQINVKSRNRSLSLSLCPYVVCYQSSVRINWKQEKNANQVMQISAQNPAWAPYVTQWKSKSLQWPSEPSMTYCPLHSTPPPILSLRPSPITLPPAQPLFLPDGLHRCQMHSCLCNVYSLFLENSSSRYSLPHLFLVFLWPHLLNDAHPYHLI